MSRRWTNLVGALLAWLIVLCSIGRGQFDDDGGGDFFNDLQRFESDANQFQQDWGQFQNDVRQFQQFGQQFENDARQFQNFNQQQRFNQQPPFGQQQPRGQQQLFGVPPGQGVLGQFQPQSRPQAPPPNAQDLFNFLTSSSNPRGRRQTHRGAISSAFRAAIGTTSLRVIGQQVLSSSSSVLRNRQARVAAARPVPVEDDLARMPDDDLRKLLQVAVTSLERQLPANWNTFLKLAELARDLAVDSQGASGAERRASAWPRHRNG